MLTDPRPARRPGRALALALVLAAVSGCMEDPGIELSWTLVADLDASTEAPELTSVSQCSSVGVSQVRVTTLAGGSDLCTGVIVDERDYPCVPASVTGPTLEPGDYTLLIRGLRRSGEPWYCSQDDPTPDEPLSACEPDPNASCYAHATVDVTVAEDGTGVAELARLLQPPQCDDGVDNDHDGRVDDRDPACLLPASANALGLESAEKGLTLFQLSTRFLSAEVVKPANVSVDAILLEVQDAADPADARSYLIEAPRTAAEVDNLSLDLGEWPFPLPLLSDAFDSGTYTLTATALDASGAALTEPVSRALVDPEMPEVLGEALPDFTVVDDEPAFVLGDFWFTSDRFLEPIVAPILLAPSLDRATTKGNPACDLGGLVQGPNGLVQGPTIERLWIRVEDESGDPLDLATLGLASHPIPDPFDAIDEGDGWISIACPATLVASSDLTWGAYSVALQARIGADVCFEAGDDPDNDDGLPLAPQPGSAGQTIELQRVLDDMGAPPPACVECQTNDDCLDKSTTECQQGVCVAKEPSSG